MDRRRRPRAVVCPHGRHRHRPDLRMHRRATPGDRARHPTSTDRRVTMQVLDYSADLPGAARIKAAGYGGAVRYIGFPDRRKCTTSAELADFTAHGLGMALVY